MSVEFQSACDAFAHVDLSTPKAGRFEFTLAGWVEFTSANTFKYVASAGQTPVNLHTLTRQVSNRMRYIFDQVGVGNAEVDALASVPTLNNWYFALISRTSATSGFIRISDAGGEFIQAEATLDVSTGSWTLGDSIDSIAFASRNLAKTTGVVDDYKGIRFGSWGFWGRGLTETEADSLRGGADPSSIPSGLISKWFDDAGNLDDSLLDGVGSNDLAILASSDGTAGSVVTPPIYSSSHPTITPPQTNPVLSNGAVVKNQTKAYGSVTTDTVEGTIWGGVFASGATPTHAEIKAGTGALGSGIVSKAVTTSDIALDPITGLTEDTAYSFWFTQENDAQDEATPITVAFTTDATLTSPFIQLDVVKDNIGTPMDNASAISYDLSSGDHSNALTSVQSDADATIVDGKLILSTPGLTVGNKYVFSAEVTTTTIYGTGVFHIRGIVTIQ